MPNRLTSSIPAIDFELTDTQGNPIRLSSYYGHKNVVLVLNRGFV